MKTCKYCESVNLITKPKPPHIGLYCCDCGKFQKWVKQEQSIESGEIASEAQQKYARHLLNKWRESKEPMLASEAGAVIGAFKTRWGEV